MARRRPDWQRFLFRKPPFPAVLAGAGLFACVALFRADARNLQSTYTGSAVQVTVQAQQAAAQQAAAVAAQAQSALTRASAALVAQRLAQEAARLAASQRPDLPNGLVPGGLMPAGGTAADPLAGIKVNPQNWINAALPTQTVTPQNKVTVDIKQTAQKAILTWDTFNVGRNTTVNFSQEAPDWIAFNRVLDPSGAPSQILGQINAPGTVYVINRNGVIFGAGSQVNVHSLLASTLDVGRITQNLIERNQYFLNLGVANLFSFSIFDEQGGPRTPITGGDVVVERGASIKTNIVGLDDPGFAYFFGANVKVAGSVTVPAGQVGMVAARTIDLVPYGYSIFPESVLPQNVSEPVKFRGTEFRISNFASVYAEPNNGSGIPEGYPVTHTYIPGTGSVTHEGLIETTRGITIMNGDRISLGMLRDDVGNVITAANGAPVQSVIAADTSIGRNSMVLLRAATDVELNGIITAMPYDDGNSLPRASDSSSTVQSFMPAYVELTAQRNVTVGASGLISAPSASVKLRSVNLTGSIAGIFRTGEGSLFSQGDTNLATSGVLPSLPGPQQVLLAGRVDDNAPGATVDVSGLNIQLPVSYNFISFKPLAEYADMPLQRNGSLFGQELTIDIRLSGTRSDGTTWVGTPLADASGVVNAYGRSIYQLMTAGGSVELETGLARTSAGTPVISQEAGSIVNVAAGQVTFTPATVPVVRLIGADGLIYTLDKANPNIRYVGLADQYVEEHSRWNAGQIYSLSRTGLEPGYTEGQSAGGVKVSGVSLDLDGTLLFGSSAGGRQVAAGQLPYQGAFELRTPSSVLIGGTQSANFITQSSFTTTLSADTLSGYGLSSLKIAANDLVVSQDSTVRLAPGGSFSAAVGGAIDIAGTIWAAGGSIALSTDRTRGPSQFGVAALTLFAEPRSPGTGNIIPADIFVSGVLDVSGRFVNDAFTLEGEEQGPAYINGGSISLTTNKSSGTNGDTTGSIRIVGGILDASSGGYISQKATPKLAGGVIAGRGGSISLVTYQGPTWDPLGASGSPVPPPANSKGAVIQLDGTLLAYGFEGNGTLRLGAVNTLRIGGALLPGEKSAIEIGGAPSVLPASLFNDGAFGAYILESPSDDYSGAVSQIVVGAGTNLTLKQINLSSTESYLGVPTGTRVGASAPRSMLADDLRKPVNVTFGASNVALDATASITTDPKSQIGITGGPDGLLSLTDPLRALPATSVRLMGSIVDQGGSLTINSLTTWIGPQAVIDLSGTLIANSRFNSGRQATSGAVVAGGTFRVEAGRLTRAGTSAEAVYDFTGPSAGSYVVADTGALVDVSGYAATIQVLGSADETTPVDVWSDAGAVKINASAFLWGGTFAALGGRSPASGLADARANGGTLILGGGSIVLRQTSADIPAALAAFHAGVNPSSIFATVDRLNAFENLYLYAGGGLGGAGRIFTNLSATTFGYASPSLSSFNIDGPIDWNVANRLHIAASLISSVSQDNTVVVNAPYVSLSGGASNAAGGTSSLLISAQTIDIEGASFAGFGRRFDQNGVAIDEYPIRLVSEGDIRLSTPKVIDGLINTATGNPLDASTFTGRLAAADNMMLSAERIYPVSNVSFTIETPGAVMFTAPTGRNSRIPISAGGAITVLADTITQSGNLFAPLGTIKLGSTATSQVTLTAGSLTSVSLGDNVVPYGETQDLTNWYYNAALTPLTQPPSKSVTLTADNVSTAAGSVVDLSGGGDLRAFEWIPGPGGSRDVLTTTPLGQTVYALLPSQNDSVAAFDVHLTTARSLDGGVTVKPGDTNPLPGTQIRIDGGAGVPAGTYTLYPAHYATVPGALRVVLQGDNLGRNTPTGTVLPDGTVLVTGHFTQSTRVGAQSSGQAVFAIQTESVWRQYSEYNFSKANAYFFEQASRQDKVVPRLPVDAGRLAAIAQQSILFDGIKLTQPLLDGNGNKLGRGGELDIAAPKLAVVGETQFANNDIPAGYIGLNVASLNGFESIMIGGSRADTTEGTLISPISLNVLVDTRGEEFSAPEIILTAQTVGATQVVQQNLTINGDPIAVFFEMFAPVSESGNVRIASGSVIKTTGEINSGLSRRYYFAEPAPIGFRSAQEVAQALGGQLDASGTLITGADLTKLPFVVFGAGGGQAHFPTPVPDLSAMKYYSLGTEASRPGLGSIFVASNDAGLDVSGPSGTSMPALNIRFAPLSGPGVPANGTVLGALTLPADAGRVILEPGANISTGTLSLQATAPNNAIVINSSDLHVKTLNLTANTIGLGPSAVVNDKSLVLYNFQFADVRALALRAISGAMSVYGDFNPGGFVDKLTLNARSIVGEGGDAKISVSNGTITLLNDGTGAPAAPVAAGASALTIEAAGIVLGGGAQEIVGFGRHAWNASDRILVAAPGSLTFGAGADVVDLDITTPLLLVGGQTSANAGSFTLSTKGNVTTLGAFRAASQEELAEVGFGGVFTIEANRIALGSAVQAQAGTLTLHATGADMPGGSEAIRLNDGAHIFAGGYKKTLVDVDTYVAGGKVVFQADAGSVATAAASVIDVAQPAGGLGYGGQIEMSARNGGAALSGALFGSGGPGLGGNFKLDIKGAVDFTPLADTLTGGGFWGAVSVHTRTGNLTLQPGHTLKANTVTLTADDPNWSAGNPAGQFGQVRIDGLIDASGYSGDTPNGLGRAGGQVRLYGANAVTLGSTGVINASTAHADERGGDVLFGIAWNAQGVIDLKQGSAIDVSGGTKGGLSGGTVTLRAPRDGADGVKIGEVAATITGARDVTVEGYVAIDTQTSTNGLDGSALGWTGIVDPAGWYDSALNLVPNGSWINVTGWKATAINNVVGFVGVPADVTVTGGGGTGARARAVMGLSTSQFPAFSIQNPGLPPNQTNIPVTFPAPPGGVAGQGVASTNAAGQLTITITNPGSGYTSVPTTAVVGGLNATVVTGRLGVVSVLIANIGSNYTSAPSISFIGGGGVSLVTFTQVGGFTGTLSNNQFIPGTSDFIPLPSSGVFDQTRRDAGEALFIGDSLHRQFFADTVLKLTQGTWTHNGASYGFGNVYNKIDPLTQQLGNGIVHVRPGVELVNSRAGGDISVVTNWNLATGAAYNLQDNGGNGSRYVHVYDDADQAKQSYVALDYRLVHGNSIEPGALALRAAGNLNIGASFSDGFFQFRDYLNSAYITSLRTYLSSTQKRGMDSYSDGTLTYYLNTVASQAIPVAPYRLAANVLSPYAKDIAAADLFPNTLRVCIENCGAANANVVSVTNPGSWSYRFTAGAEFGSANTDAVQPLGALGDVLVKNHTSYAQPLFVDNGNSAQNSVTVNLPTMLRTGTGAIDIAAARDVIMQDTVAPGVIYAAGVNTPRLPGANYQLQTTGSATFVTAANPNGFFEPQILMYGNTASVSGGLLFYGPPTAAAFPHMGGDVEIEAQRDIVGFDSTGNKSLQYYKQWLMSQAELTPANTASAGNVNLFGSGVYVPFSNLIASQSAWWIQYSKFQQGILSAGGNVTVKAGRDMRDVSVSLPTTGRVSGGLSLASTPVTHSYDSGNMVVQAGRDILGGSFYEGSGSASVRAGRSIGANGTVSRFSPSVDIPNGSAPLPDVPLLAVDGGQIEVLAVGAVTVAGVINPAQLHAQPRSNANPTGDVSNPLFMDTYGPNSAARVISLNGDITIRTSPTSISQASGQLNNRNGNALSTATYPATFEAVSLSGDIDTTGIFNPTPSSPNLFSAMPGLVLSPSEHGSLKLLAQGSIDLTFGYPDETLLLDATPRPFISTGPALIDSAFNPFRPNNGFANALSAPVLAHANDDAIVRIYAATGDITSTGGYGRRTRSDTFAGYQRAEINQPAKIFAGRDIVDLNLIVQNIRPSDVSEVIAGRNLYFTGWNNGGGLQVAGPGFFAVQAGGDIGPFLPATFNLESLVSIQHGIASVGNASQAPVGNIYVPPNRTGGSVGMYNAALLGPFTRVDKRRNALLPDVAGTDRGADVIVRFGVKFGANYDGYVDQNGQNQPGFIDLYVNPANAANVTHNYLEELRDFLIAIGKPAPSADTVWTTFTSLPASLQRVFADKVFFSELKAVGLSQATGAAEFERGYTAVNAMFPSGLGYTANQIGSQTPAEQLVKTGDLDILHATIQTRLGGEISVFGPGGTIRVGSLTTEPNSNLKLRDLGILTLGGGAIQTFTDQSVLVNSSRVFTTQGGDVLMWSSNVDLDAGRGSKTTVSLPPLQVLFDADDYQSVDLGGFVSGAGIGVLVTSSLAEVSSVYLLAPRGRIDAGTAGIRSSGNLVVAAVQVVNAGNIQVGGTATGVGSITVPNISGLAAASNSSPTTVRGSDLPTGSVGSREAASVFVVEVIGYGGGDGQVTGSTGPASSAAPASGPVAPAAASTTPAGSTTPANGETPSNSEEESKKQP